MKVVCKTGGHRLGIFRQRIATWAKPLFLCWSCCLQKPGTFGFLSIPSSPLLGRLYILTTLLRPRNIPWGWRHSPICPAQYMALKSCWEPYNNCSQLSFSSSSPSSRSHQPPPRKWPWLLSHGDTGEETVLQQVKWRVVTKIWQYYLKASN